MLSCESHMTGGTDKREDIIIIVTYIWATFPGTLNIIRYRIEPGYAESDRSILWFQLTELSEDEGRFAIKCNTSHQIFFSIPFHPSPIHVHLFVSLCQYFFPISFDPLFPIPSAYIHLLVYPLVYPRPAFSVSFTITFSSEKILFLCKILLSSNLRVWDPLNEKKRFYDWCVCLRIVYIVVWKNISGKCYQEGKCHEIGTIITVKIIGEKITDLQFSTK